MARRSPISRASLRRLAADVGAKLPAAFYEQAAQELEEFVREAVRHALRAGACSGKKAVGRAQVQYGLRSSGSKVPLEVLRLSDMELRRMRRCNLRAPVQTRKASALNVEIPEASFARLLAHIALELTPERSKTVRFSAAARRVLHATTETHTAQRLKELCTEQPPQSEQPCEEEQLLAPLLPGVPRILKAQGVPAELAHDTAAMLERVCAALESLLDMGGCVTVSPRHMQAALSAAAGGKPAPAAPTAEELAALPSEAVAALERAVRGRLPDRRFSGDSGRLLAGALLKAAGIIHDVKK